MIYVGSEIIPYEPYKGNNITVSTPNGLPGIPVSSGGNYTDDNGQQWVCDKIDFGRGVYVQRIVEKILDGSEEWYAPSYKYYRVKVGDYGSIYTGAELSTHFQRTTIAASNENIGVYAFNSTSDKATINIRRVEDAVNVTSFKTWLAEKYKSGDPVIVCYALTTPTETPLSAEEIEAYRALMTNYPDTTVYTDAGARIDMEYTADTKLYIDNKFAELSAAILNN